MRDIMQMSYEASQIARSPLEHQTLFTEMLFNELGQMKSADIAPHLSCTFDVIRREYKVLLLFRARLNESDSVKSDVK